MKRNTFLSTAGLVMLSAVVAFSSCNSGTSKSGDSSDKGADADEAATAFKISLAQWSYHRTFFGNDSTEGVDPVEFPAMAADLGIDCIELVNQFYMDYENDAEYWKHFKAHCDDAGVKVGLIMCDGLGALGDADAEARKTAVENHYPWVDIAASLGAHTIRVNARGEGTREEVAANAADGLKMLGEYGASKGIHVVVENHGGYSSDGSWLAGVMEAVDMEYVGTLPDFGNFCIEGWPGNCENEYDRYLGTKELMPYATGVSAKSYDFDEQGNETTIDYLKMMKIVKESGYTGYVGIEYEGRRLSEEEGIKATKALLEKVFAEI